MSWLISSLWGRIDECMYSLWTCCFHLVFSYFFSTLTSLILIWIDIAALEKQEFAAS